MMCPAASCFPLLRGLPALPCLLSWAQHGDGDTATTATWPAATSSTGTGVNQDTLTPPICPEKHTPPSLSPPRNKHKHALLGYIPSQRQRTDSVNTDQGEAEAEASQLQLQAACICPCSSSSCRWQGTLGDVVPHLIQSHQQLVTQREGTEVVFPFNTSTSSSSPSSSAAAAEDNATTAEDWVMLQSCFRRTFVLVVKRVPAVVAGGGAGPGPAAALFHAAVLFVGLSEEAEGFVYRLELRGNRRRLMWEATPRVIQDNAANTSTSTFVPMTTTSALIPASDCMTFDLSVAELFTQDSQGTLALHVSISRAWSSTTDTTDPIPRHSQERTPTHRQLIARVHPTSRMQESLLT